MFGGALNLPNFIVDRLCATLLPVRYEAKGNRFPLIAITMIFTQMILTAVGVVAYVNGKISDLQQTIIFTSFCVFSAVVFSILPIMTRKIHDYHKKKHSSVSLRYQSMENLRVARLLNILMIFVSIMVMTCSHPKLRSALPQTQKKTRVSTTCSRNIVSTDGRVLSFSADEEQKIYFDSYLTMWQK
ncbi:hypothetical protein ANCDUO_05852 [Ancylostoma duodenale]|uniref:Uncharacterized protein n=1 Tax=Ancylostoma duodenale TaxID=51022 RepID=A0A0C2GXQ5_9BILA|nr:hypothetical protein ANCDUO_05852 [Ancylostoma duodenale]